MRRQPAPPQMKTGDDAERHHLVVGSGFNGAPASVAQQQPQGTELGSEGAVMFSPRDEPFSIHSLLAGLPRNSSDASAQAGGVDSQGVSHQDSETTAPWASVPVSGASSDSTAATSGARVAVYRATGGGHHLHGSRSTASLDQAYNFAGAGHSAHRTLSSESDYHAHHHHHARRPLDVQQQQYTALRHHSASSAARRQGFRDEANLGPHDGGGPGQLSSPAAATLAYAPYSLQRPRHGSSGHGTGHIIMGGSSRVSQRRASISGPPPQGPYQYDYHGLERSPSSSVHQSGLHMSARGQQLVPPGQHPPRLDEPLRRSLPASYRPSPDPGPGSALSSPQTAPGGGAPFSSGAGRDDHTGPPDAESNISAGGDVGALREGGHPPLVRSASAGSGGGGPAAGAQQAASDSSSHGGSGLPALGSSQWEHVYKHQRNFRPGVSYQTMITQALESDDGRPKTLKEIYAWVEDNYAYYRKQANGGASWRSTVRHTLVTQETFMKVQTPRPDDGRLVACWTTKALAKAQQLSIREPPPPLES